MRRIKFIKASIVVALLFMVQAMSAQTPVEQYGQLSISGSSMIDSAGEPVQLRGMSFFWSQWEPDYYTYNTVEWLRDDWKCSVVRAAMGVNGNSDGYLVNPEAEKAKIQTLVDAAIDLGIYVIIDWHSHHALDEQDEAVAFFSEMAQTYGDYPNVIYEPFNEPEDADWNSQLKPYHEAVIAAIREYDSDNIIVCGTSTWSQDVDDAAANPITAYDNIAYTLHYYANTHLQWLRDRAAAAINSGIALFVTEFGTCNSDGDVPVNASESELWFDFMDEYMLSWCNWSVADKVEAASAMYPGASPDGGWTLDQITLSGTIVRNKLIERYYQENPDSTAAPIITSNPIASTVGFGLDYTLDVAVVSVETPQYQWYFNGAEIAGATAQSYEIIGFADENEGTYFVAITNGNGTSYSDTVELSVIRRSPYDGIIQIPGTLQAENFDIGGNGYTYSDNTSGDAAVDAGGTAYRVSDCDIQEIEGEAGSYQVGWVASGEWAEYTVNVDSAGEYTLEARVATQDGSGIINITAGSNSASIAVTNTGGWHDMAVVSTTLTLEEGEQVIKIAYENVVDGINLDKIEFSIGGTDTKIDENNTSISIAPTVVSDFITIDVDQVSICEIYSVFSKVDEIEINTKTLYSVSDLEPGIYIVKVSNQDGSIVERILVK